MGYMKLKFCMSDKHHRYYKHTKFCQNLRGDPKFLVDLTIFIIFHPIRLLFMAMKSSVPLTHSIGCIMQVIECKYSVSVCLVV